MSFAHEEERKRSVAYEMQNARNELMRALDLVNRVIKRHVALGVGDLINATVKKFDEVTGEMVTVPVYGDNDFIHQDGMAPTKHQYNTVLHALCSFAVLAGTLTAEQAEAICGEPPMNAAQISEALDVWL